ncbi:MAG: 4Fe-4S cluster-binding domain-containing protein [Magnetococcales bacterium]|nr:4Fe-4S cluster-binding domain-containing protein [Magnetococcales bacterium]
MPQWIDDLFAWLYLKPWPIFGRRHPFLKKVRKKINAMMYPKRGIAWIPHNQRMEIEIITACNLKCYSCNRSSTQAPSGEMMCMEQLHKFLEESNRLNWPWRRLALIGGEPTIHPKFKEIVDLFQPYMEQNPECFLQVSTNGYGKKVKQKIADLPEWVVLQNSEKQGSNQSFVSYNVAPCDVDEYQNTALGPYCLEYHEDQAVKACVLVEGCGIALTRYGYYACGPGASIDRVFGFNIGIKKLEDVTHENFKKQLRSLCKYCGHYKHSDMNQEEKEILLETETVSSSWRKAYADYKQEKPKLDLY